MAPCPDCAAVPEGDERPLSYLLSRHHLRPAELDRASQRIRDGEAPLPSPALLEIARQELTASTSTGARPDPDPGLTSEEKLLFALASAALTPLVGIVAWWSWRRDRPEASRQVLTISAPIAAALAAIWCWVMFLR
jgi:hypothetical protein